MIQSRSEYVDMLTGVDGELWEPMWKVNIKLLPIEKELLKTYELKRLHFIKHSGGSYINTHVTHSRLQHTIGVLALVSKFFPDNIIYRVAALLHDIGHVPLSHALEKIEDIDHHKWTLDIIANSEITQILDRYGLDKNMICSIIEGDTVSPLRNKEKILQLDHFESFIREANASGYLEIPADQILKKIYFDSHYVETDIETGKMIMKIIAFQNRCYCTEMSIGTGTVLADLTRKLIKEGLVDINGLPKMIDVELEGILLNSELTKEAARKLWFKPHELTMVRYSGRDLKENEYIAEFKKTYLSEPLVGGNKVTETCEEVRKMITDIENLKGKYIVSWSGK